MSTDLPTFAKGEAVHHPFNDELYGNVVSQDRGSVVVQWEPDGGWPGTRPRA